MKAKLNAKSVRNLEISLWVASLCVILAGFSYGSQVAAFGFLLMGAAALVSVAI